MDDNRLEEPHEKQEAGAPTPPPPTKNIVGSKGFDVVHAEETEFSVSSSHSGGADPKAPFGVADSSSFSIPLGHGLGASHPDATPSSPLSESLDIRPPSEESILRRVRTFEDASEADLPLESELSSRVNRVTGIGSILDKKYRIVHKIATGGMGVVYSAVHVKLGKQFAIKVIAPGTLANEEAHRRFVREAKASTLLSSPHTVRVFDYNITLWGEPYLVMEYVSGQNLRQCTAKEGSFTAERTVHIAKQIAQSLMEAHDNGLVHRDLKPSNVMLMQSKGHRDFVKIFDFGVVKFMTSPDDHDLTRQGSMLGTPRYMAPEQINSPEDVTYAADIYSLGLLMYFLLTGEKPFSDLPSNMVIVQKLDKKVHTKLPKDLELPKSFLALYAKMTSNDPKQRPSAEDVYLQLGDLETELKVGTWSGSAAMRLPPISDTSANQYRAWIVLLLLLLAGVVTWALWPAPPTPPQGKSTTIAAQTPPGQVRQPGTTTDRPIAPPIARPIARPDTRPHAQPEISDTTPAPRSTTPAITPPVQPPRRRPKQIKRIAKRIASIKRTNITRKQKIEINCSPSTARVTRNGKVLGSCPVTISRFRSQTVILYIKKDGYFTSKLVIPKRANKRSYRVRLKEIRIELP